MLAMLLVWATAIRQGWFQLNFLGLLVLKLRLEVTAGRATNG